MVSNIEKSYYKSLQKRLSYLDQYGRDDIELFAQAAVDAKLIGIAEVEQRLPADFALWVERVEQQSAFEKDFPIGCRLGTFATSPVLGLRDMLNRRKPINAFDSVTLQSSLRVRCCIDRLHDTKMENLAIYSISTYVGQLQQLQATDPILAYLLLAKEIRFAWQYIDATKAGPFNHAKACLMAKSWRGEPIAVAAALAEHERLLALVQALHDKRPTSATTTTYKGLIEARDGLPKGNFVPHRHVNEYLQAARMSVPALWSVASPFGEPPATWLNPVVDETKPTGRGGDHSVKSIYHYYGVEPYMLLCTGLVEIFGMMAGIGKRATETPTAFCPPRPRDLAVGLAGEVVRTIANKVGLPISSWEETRRRLKFVRRAYLRPARKHGGAGRFEPALWLIPDRDFKLYLRLVKVGNDTRTDGKGSSKFQNYKSALASRLYPKNSIYNQTDADLKLAARVVAHLATSHGLFTTDPIYLRGHKVALDRVGYKPTR